MTAVIHHGPPGSFKSFGTVQRAAIPALIGKLIKETGETEGRIVVTNIRGFNSLQRIEEAMGEKLHPDSKIIYVDADSEKGFNAMRVFHHWAPIGALIAMDETQRIYSKKRHRDLKQFDLRLTDSEGNRRPKEDILRECPLWDGDYDRPETVETAFDQHRHYNWDIYCTTPNISKVHPEIREVVEVAYRHRGKGAFLPIWRNKWMEFAHDSETSGKSASHYMGSPKDYTADKRVFACYQSTKTGKAVGTSEPRYIYHDPKFQIFAIGVLFTICAFFYVGYQAYTTNPLFNGLKSEDSQEVVKAPDKASDNSGGNVDSSVSVANDLEAKFDSLASEPVSDDITSAPEKRQVITTRSVDVTGLDGFIGAYHSKGYQIKLGAIVQSSKRLVYRIQVFDGDNLIDEISDFHINKMGYTHSFDGHDLTIKSEHDHFLIRPFGSIQLGAEATIGRSYARTQGADALKEQSL